MKKRNTVLKTIILLTATMLIITTVTPLTVVHAAPTTIFSEGFEDWVPPPPFPPPGWAVYNVNGGNTWQYSLFDGVHTGWGSAKCIYELDASQNDDWLTTKGTVVALGGVFSLWVDTFIFGDDEYEIYMSTTGNTPADFLAGTLLLGVYFPVPTVYTQYTFDMSLYVGQTVYFGIRYIGFYAWHIWVDDVTFPDGTTEGFESFGGWPGWSQEIISGTHPDNRWEGVATGTLPSCSPHSGSWMARYGSWWALNDCSARLKYDTAFDFLSTGFDVFNVTFWMYHDTGWSECADRVSVCVSTDGSTWDTLATFNRYDGTTGWAQHSVDLSAYKDNSIVYLGFLAESGWGNNMFLDDVEITGELSEIIVSIDIKPGSDPNSINLKEKGVFTVAILGSAEIDVTDVDPDTVALDGVSMATRGNAQVLAYSIEDVNGDGVSDFVAQFKVPELVAAGALTETTTELVLTAALFDATPLSGVDAVRVVPPQ